MANHQSGYINSFGRRRYCTGSCTREMPDRIISATAQYLDIPLVTGDTKIQALKLETIW
jgi:PIN domain nuclease of toxin-antitoxin system